MCVWNHPQGSQYIWLWQIHLSLKSTLVRLKRGLWRYTLSSSQPLMTFRVCRQLGYLYGWRTLQFWAISLRGCSHPGTLLSLSVYQPFVLYIHLCTCVRRCATFTCHHGLLTDANIHWLCVYIEPSYIFCSIYILDIFYIFLNCQGPLHGIGVPRPVEHLVAGL